MSSPYTSRNEADTLNPTRDGAAALLLLLLFPVLSFDDVQDFVGDCKLDLTAVFFRSNNVVNIPSRKRGMRPLDSETVPASEPMEYVLPLPVWP